MKKLSAVIGLALLAVLMAVGTVFAGSVAFTQQDGGVNVEVCHEDGQSGNFSLVTVSVHSVDDANGLNGHGDHEGDSWEPFIFDGVDYAGQGDMDNCDDDGPPPPPPYENCSDQVDLNPTIEYGDWSEWIYNAQSGLEERTRTVTTTVVQVDARDGSIVCDTEVTQEIEIETRNPEEPPGPTPTPTPTPKPDDDDGDDDKPDRHPATGPETLSFEVLFGLGIAGLGAIGYGASLLRRSRK